MSALIVLVAVAWLVFVIWWMLSTRAALKAIQRKLGADPDHVTMEEARAYRAEQKAQEQAGRRRV